MTAVSAAKTDDHQEKSNVSHRDRLVYIRQRLIELRDEREKLIAERDWMKQGAKDNKQATEAPAA